MPWETEKMTKVTLIITALLLTACSGFTALEPGLHLSIESATVPETTGVALRHWDPEEADPRCAPDPYVILIGDGWECSTVPDSDTLEPMWGHLCNSLDIEPPFRVTWVLIDADADADEVIMQGAAYITTADIEAGEVVLTAAESTLTLTIEVIE